MESLAGVLALFLCAGACHAQAEDILRGARDGAEAGRREGLLMPVIVGGGAATVLALRDDSKLNNNRIVTALVVNAAVSAAAVWVASAVLPPRPSASEHEMLARESQLYSRAWRIGFRDAAGDRRLTANVLGVLTGIAFSVALYARRAE